jgi:RNA polymerase sigma factor (TIGR02999 family)
MPPQGPLPRASRRPDREDTSAVTEKDLSGAVTAALIAYRDGGQAAADRLLSLVYLDLKRVARRQLGPRSRDDVLDTTALVHETYLRLVDQQKVDYQDRGHFFAIAARVMRRVVVDFARARGARKRGGGAAGAPLEAATAVREAEERDVAEILAVDRAVERLEEHEPALARIVECRFFAGLSEAETAAALGVSLRSTQRGWQRARRWLALELGGSDAEGSRDV